ncbi:MAG TPA: hypothetical protein VEQ65_06100, partial [Opitutus sp.]|nr:hypothetical protein [Opitutus sp.]
NGGYLADTVRRESPADGAAPHAVLVSRAWAETFDANSPRAFSGRDVVLLEKANRVWRLDGFDPTEGIPQKLSRTASIELTPHSSSELQLTLAAADSNAAGSVRWQITRRLGHVRPQVFEVSGRGPWTIAVPLVGGQTQRLEFTATADSSAAPEHYTVSALRIVGVP